MRQLVIGLAIVLTVGIFWAIADTSKIEFPKQGSIDRAQGLAAWSRIYEVTSHPRCANCHVGENDVPMWSGPSYGETRPHGMNIKAGKSRIGSEYLPCGSCHVQSARPQTTAHAAPRANGVWQLSPPGAGWFGKPSNWICEQLRNPARNGGMDYKKLADHAGHDVILKWAWSPGKGREPAPYTNLKHRMDIHVWGAAGQPCPDE